MNHNKIEVGKQTQITPEVLKIAEGIRGKTLEKIIRIIDFVKELRAERFDEKLFRKRTADQIIKDKFVTGCTDAALVFVTLARACQIPAVYIETIDKGWLESEDEKSFRGHQYSQVWAEEENSWIWVDPFGGRMNTPAPEKEGRVIYKTGLDSWDIGIIDFESLQKAFIEFRKSYKATLL